MISILRQVRGVAALLPFLLETAGSRDAVASEDSGFASHVTSVVTEYCLACHSAEKKRGEIDLEQFQTAPDLQKHRELWEKVLAALESHEMPPENKRQPSEEARRSMVEWLTTEMARQDALAPSEPGRVTARRLNRNEYRNTVRDLVGVDYDAHQVFPNDESGYGFDNIGDVLSLPPMLLEKYLAAAEEIARLAISTEDPARRRVARVRASQFSTMSDAVSTIEDEVWGFYREGEIATDHDFKAAGEYRLRLSAYGEQAGPDLPKMSVRFDGKEIQVQSVRALEDKPESFEIPLTVETGRHRIAVAFLNNFNSDGDRNLFLRSLEVIGPLGGPVDEYPEPHRRILPRRPAAGQERAYATEVLRKFASRAYRRPATDSQVNRLAHLVDMAREDGASFEEGIRLAIQAVLVSPNFLFRWELDSAPLAPGQTRELDGYEIASRLSYFLWSSMPDDPLFELAAQGALTRPEVREAQVHRMMADPRASAFLKNFGGQWLQIRNLDEVAPDETIFPGWDIALRNAMREETELFLDAIIREDRSIKELIDADFTFVNERLARHYGILDVTGDEFRRVKFPTGSGRGGVLTLGGVLTITSVPTRTAPVLRGKWILEQILGTPPPPPPPNIPTIEDGATLSKSATIRQRTELHRSKPECMGCHQKMDPLGFALENFDAIGAWREQDGDLPIDNSAELPGGRKFAGAAGLKAILRDGNDFPKALSARVLTYALGRGLEPRDRRAVQFVTERLAKNDFKFSALLLGVVESEPFLKRQPEPTRHEQRASLDP